MVGLEIFHFLSVYSKTRLGSEFKSRVRLAIRAGNAISLDLTLCTKRLMGFEKFASHWTPLKNEASQVGWVVLTLGSLNDQPRT